MGNNNPKDKRAPEKEPTSREQDEVVRPAAQASPTKEPEPVLVPTKFTWRYGGSEVLLTGSRSTFRTALADTFLIICRDIFKLARERCVETWRR